jgi:hypothetical protein
MFLLRYRLTPAAGCSNVEQYGGAIVNCYVDVQTQSEAEMLATKLILENEWSMLQLEQANQVSPEDLPANSDARAWAEQAIVDQCVLVFHTWPIGGAPASG